VPQIQLPIFPAGSSFITQELSFELCYETVFYFNGHLPVFSNAMRKRMDFAVVEPRFKSFLSPAILKADVNASLGAAFKNTMPPFAPLRRAPAIWLFWDATEPTITPWYLLSLGEECVPRGAWLLGDAFASRRLASGWVWGSAEG